MLFNPLPTYHPTYQLPSQPTLHPPTQPTHSTHPLNQPPTLHPPYTHPQDKAKVPTTAVARHKSRSWTHMTFCAFCAKSKATEQNVMTKCAHCPRVFHADCLEGHGLTRGTGTSISVLHTLALALARALAPFYTPLYAPSHRFIVSYTPICNLSLGMFICPHPDTHPSTHSCTSHLILHPHLQPLSRYVHMPSPQVCIVQSLHRLRR